MDSKNIIQNELSLSTTERILIIEALSESLSEPNQNIETFWKEEVEKGITLSRKVKYKLFLTKIY